MDSITIDGGRSAFFVTGTGTGVGKTVLSMLLMTFFFKKGLSPFYLKPFQTGCRTPLDRDSDAKFVYSHVEELKGKDPAESMLYCLENPKAPLFAARDAGVSLDMGLFFDRIRHLSPKYAPLVMEAAGGLFVPVTQNLTMLDLMRETGARPVVAAPAGLGTINHTLLTLEALKREGMVDPVVFFMDSGETETPAEMIRENMEAVEMFSGIKVAGVIKKIDDFSKSHESCFQGFEGLMD